jgi:hypothetical protein
VTAVAVQHPHISELPRSVCAAGSDRTRLAQQAIAIAPPGSAALRQWFEPQNPTNSGGILTPAPCRAQVHDRHSTRSSARQSCLANLQHTKSSQQGFDLKFMALASQGE